MYQSDNPSAIRSKRVITQALLKLMEKYSYEEITVKEIIYETDVTRKTFYRNFDSKDDVLNSYISSLLSDYKNRILENPDCDVIQVIFDECVKNKDFLQLLNKNHLLYLVLNELNKLIPVMHNESLDERNPFVRLFGEIKPDYLISFNVGAIWNIVCRWIENGMIEPPEEIAALLKAYLASWRGNQ